MLLSYYNYYTQNEPDEYYIRAHYIYIYQEHLNDLSEALFLLAYSFAQKMSDDQKIKMIEKIFSSANGRNACALPFRLFPWSAPLAETTVTVRPVLPMCISQPKRRKNGRISHVSRQNDASFV